MVKLEKQFRELSLKKGQDPEVWITELEDLCIKLESMGSCIIENQFMIQTYHCLLQYYLTYIVASNDQNQPGT
jgi:hypothetical protein